MKKRIFLIVIFILGIISFSVGCGEEEIEELTTITILQPVNKELWAPIYLAHSLGYFYGAGLEVEFVDAQDGMGIEKVLNGNIDFGLSESEMVVKFNEDGQGVKMLLSTSRIYPYSLMSQPNVNTITDLKGQNISAGSTASSQRQFVRFILKNEGLDPDSDVSYVDLQVSEIITGMENNEVQATYSQGYINEKLSQMGMKTLVDMFDPVVHKEVLGSETYEANILFTSDKMIEEDKETVQKTVNAVYKAIKWLDSQSSDAIYEQTSHFFSSQEEDTAEETIKVYKDNKIYSDDGGFTNSGFEAIIKMGIDSGLFTESVEKNDVIDDSFIIKAQENVE